MAPFVEAGLPFLWWSTPSTWSPGTHRALEAAGAVREDSPGCTSTSRGSRPPAGRSTASCSRSPSPRTWTPSPGSCARASSSRAGLEEAIRRLFEGFDPEQLVNVLATLDGEPVGCGSLWITGETAGVYNIAVLDQARHRGVGYAVTSFLLDEARARGCTESVLQATRLGRPVYERLGYVEVCRVPQYVWLPDRS